MEKNHTLHDLVLAGVRWELCDKKNEECEMRNEGLTNDKPDSSFLIPRSVSPIITPVVSTSDSLAAALAAAQGATNFEELCAAIEKFPHPLKQFSKTILPRLIPHSSFLTIITDAPTSDDEQAGAIMSGAAGDLLDKMLGAIGMKRDDVAIIPLLFWRTPGGRSATPEELSLARQFVMRAIELSREPRTENREPKAIILTLGSVAQREVGSWLPAFDSWLLAHNIPHPNMIILKPELKKDAWAVLQEIQNILQNDKK